MRPTPAPMVPLAFSRGIAHGSLGPIDAGRYRDMDPVCAPNLGG
jgi:hypothetical protein